MKSLKILFACLVIVLAASAIYAQDDEIVDTLPPDVVFPSQDVKHTTIFPDHVDHAFPTATVIDSFTSFHNLGKKTFNVTSIYGSLHHVNELNYYLQNFTRLRYDVIVQPNDQLTFEFQFYADNSLEPRDYHMIIRADYYDLHTRLMYTTTFFNNTVSLVENEAASDSTGLIVTLLIIAATGGYILHVYLGKKAAKAAKATKAASKNMDDDLAGTNIGGKFHKSPKGTKSS